MTIGERIKQLRVEHGLTQEELATRLGYKHKTSISKIEADARRLTQPKIQAIACIFNVTPSELLLGVSDDDTLIEKKKIPVLGRVAAGYPIEAVENIIDYEEISEEMARSGEYFALQVKGDSMLPRFADGDIVIVRKQEDIDSGDIAIMLVNGHEATIKKVQKFENGINLIPSNPAYDVMTFTKKEIISLPVVCLGKVVELRAKF